MPHADVCAAPKVCGCGATDSSSSLEPRAAVNCEACKVVRGAFHSCRRIKTSSFSLLPLVSGLVSPAGARCAAPPADRGALSESPQAGDRETES